MLLAAEGKCTRIHAGYAFSLTFAGLIYCIGDLVIGLLKLHPVAFVPNGRVLVQVRIQVHHKYGN